MPESRGGSSTGDSNTGGSGLADLAIVAEERGRLVSPGPLLPTSVAAWTLALAEAAGAAGDAGPALEATLSGDAVCAWVVARRATARG